MGTEHSGMAIMARSDKTIGEILAEKDATFNRLLEDYKVLHIALGAIAAQHDITGNDGVRLIAAGAKAALERVSA